jgi:hypothetical protein
MINVDPSIGSRIAQAGRTVMWGGGLFVAGCAGVVVTPLLSVVMLPISTVGAALLSLQHRNLYNKTLTNLTREPFGRIQGQDYTRWDGRAEPRFVSKEEHAHAQKGIYVHGVSGNKFKPSADSPFRTQDDLDWLNREFDRRIAKERVDDCWASAGLSLRGLIPVIGFIWLCKITVRLSMAGSTPCSTCYLKGTLNLDHWKWSHAINFHREHLKQRLGEQINQQLASAL